MGRYTIKDIAKLAGVGVGTVSRAINNEPGIKAETKEKVLKIMKEVKYTPNHTARSLKKGSKKMVGVIIKGSSNSFFTKVIEGIQDILRSSGYIILEQYTGREDIMNSVNFFLDKKVDGLIFLGGNKKDEIPKLNLPVIYSSALDREKLIHTLVIIDNVKSVYNSMRFLSDKGYKKIAIITSDNGDDLSNQRLKGYEEYIEEQNIDYYCRKIGDYSIESGYESAKELLNQRDHPDAIFAISDMMAIGAAKAILEEGKRIPEDIAIMGFDGIEMSKYYQPSITTVSQPQYELGEISAKLLLNNMSKRVAKGEKMILETEIIERAST